MKKGSNETVLWILGIPAAGWLALLSAPCFSEGLARGAELFARAMQHPWKVTWCADTPRVLFLFLCGYGLFAALSVSSRKNYRKNEEHGSARWGNAHALCRRYAEREYSQNKLLTRHVRIGLDGKKHRRNLSVLVIGGSGAGKTRFYCKPNVMQCNTSFVVLDPKG